LWQKINRKVAEAVATVTRVLIVVKEVAGVVIVVEKVTGLALA
jgi:hypothetical protein